MHWSGPAGSKGLLSTTRWPTTPCWLKRDTRPANVRKGLQRLISGKKSAGKRGPQEQKGEMGSPGGEAGGGKETRGELKKRKTGFFGILSKRDGGSPLIGSLGERE